MGNGMNAVAECVRDTLSTDMLKIRSVRGSKTGAAFRGRDGAMTGVPESPMMHPGQVKVICSVFGELVVRVVANEFDVAVDMLKSQNRCCREICIARQTCMYLLHTSFSLSYQEVGRLLGRDRTTVSHGCAIVEDLRDNGEFDERISRVEEILASISPLVGMSGIRAQEAV